MKTQGRIPLYVSVAVISTYWIYQLMTMNRHPTLPSSFSELVLIITRNKLITLSVIIVLLKFQEQGPSDVGLTFQNGKRHFLRGLLYGTIMFVMINVLLTSLLNSVFPPTENNDAGIMTYFKDANNLLVWLLIGILGGGFVEELQRVFVLTRFQQWMGRSGIIIALALSSFFFGAGHLYQGIGAAISTGIGGLCFGLVYLSRRSALEAITAHAFSDVLAILAATFLVH